MINIFLITIYKLKELRMEVIDDFLDKVNRYQWNNGIKEFSKDIYDQEYAGDDYYLEEKYMLFTSNFIRYWENITTEKKKKIYRWKTT